jgi:hypothetical protein
MRQDLVVDLTVSADFRWIVTFASEEKPYVAKALHLSLEL